MRSYWNLLGKALSLCSYTWRGGPGSGSGDPPPSASTAATFYFSTQPSGATDESALATQPVVQARSVAGVDVAVAGITVSLSLGSGSTVGGLSGNLNIVTNANGTSTFTNVVVDSSNSTIGVLLIATPNGGQPAVNSTAFQVNQKYVPPPSGAGIGAGPNMPPGLVQSYWSVFDGQSITSQTPNSPNKYGMFAAPSQYPSMTTQPAPTSPNTSQSKLCWAYWGSERSDWPLCFQTGQGGGSPNRWYQSTMSSSVSGGYVDTSGVSELYVRYQIAYEGLLTTGYLTSISSSVPVVCGSATTNSVTSLDASWTVNQFQGMFLRKISGSGAGWNTRKIISNTAQKLSLNTAFDNTASPGDTFAITSWVTTGTQGNNVAIKGFFCRITAEVGGSGTVHGIPWSVATTRVYSGNDGNNSLNMNDLIDGTVYVGSAQTTDAIDFAYEYQQYDWDGATTDGDGAIGTWTTYPYISSGLVSRFGWPAGRNLLTSVSASTNSIFDVELYIKANSASGVSDGIFRCWVNGVSRFSISTLVLCPNYCAHRVEAGATDWTVPLRTANPRIWGFHFDPTYGGGLRIPNSTGTVHLFGFYAAGR